jgi:hypothetical protein
LTRRGESELVCASDNDLACLALRVILLRFWAAISQA